MIKAGTMAWFHNSCLNKKCLNKKQFKQYIIVNNAYIICMIKES